MRTRGSAGDDPLVFKVSINWASLLSNALTWAQPLTLAMTRVAQVGINPRLGRKKYR